LNIAPGKHQIVTRGPDADIDAISVLRVFLSNSDPAFVVSEIAEDLEVTPEGARHQMNKLVERGLLAKKKPGKRTVIYWITDEGVQHYVEETEG
jgi:predicted transcriptional regulator